MTQPTLIELLESAAADDDEAADHPYCDPGPHRKYAARATALRAASQRLRTEIAVWREVEPGMAYTGEVVKRCLERINGDVQTAGPLPTPTAPTCAERCGQVLRRGDSGGYVDFANGFWRWFCAKPCLEAKRHRNPVPR